MKTRAGRGCESGPLFSMSLLSSTLKDRARPLSSDIAAGLLFGALARQSHDYYTLRWATCRHSCTKSCTGTRVQLGRLLHRRSRRLITLVYLRRASGNGDRSGADRTWDRGGAGRE